MTSPAILLLSLANHDQRVCFAFNITKNSFVYLNPAFDKFFQLSSLQATPKLLYSMVHPEDCNYVKSSYQSLEPGVFKENLEFRMILPDLKEYTVRLNIFLDVQENNDHIVTGYMEDITSIKAHDDKLKELSNKKNSVLNILSHDLAGPLGSIKNYAVLLSKKTRSLEDEQVNNIISSIEKISKRSILMIQEFIKQEFIESIGVDLVKKRVDIVEKLQEFMEEYFLTQNETGKVFNFHSSHPNIFVEIDENKFIQVINNLISNSIKFTPDGGTISINITQNEENILVSVADTGVGIPKKFHDNLFEKFPESRRTGLKGEPSVGLGMSIIKTIVEWHHGKIWFESAENKGSTFYIELPNTEEVSVTNTPQPANGYANAKKNT
jgi:two-component system sensor histidine kinase VicK